jgi:hypothetical protein
LNGFMQRLDPRKYGIWYSDLCASSMRKSLLKSMAHGSSVGRDGHLRRL